LKALIAKLIAAAVASPRDSAIMNEQLWGFWKGLPRKLLIGNCVQDPSTSTVSAQDDFAITTVNLNIMHGNYWQSRAQWDPVRPAIQAD
jgi:hypothetical protein